ncbi:hypothetical protein ACJIZ3_013312 [Penstemon smallii]|uniref:Uncharacterized protein n=1 Tax=Penstemon smallii TaxID=265156 RepID=A0ABD3UQT0_9LAMI
MTASPPSLLLICILLLSSTLSLSFSFSSYHKLLSFSHTLSSRVATLREARGDLEGADRARSLARNLEPGLGMGFYKHALNVGWDYVLGEFTKFQSDAERVGWVCRNYENTLRVSKSLFARLIGVCRESGPLREVVEALQKEVVEGDLLKDCLKVGANDLKGLIQVFKEIALQYASASPRTEL